MKKLGLLLLFIAIGAGLYMTLLKPSSTPFELEEGYTWLYNGQNLEGWRVIGGESTFEADGESIKGIHGPGENTFLRTDKTYSDFNLRMQMRWDEPGNSGVLFRAQQREGNGRAYGYQYELDHSDRAWSGGIYDEARRGWLYSLENSPDARDAIKLDGWNDIEIDARGGKLQTWINGVPAATVVDAFDPEGFIALQVHSGEIGVMRWRHIRIKELPAIAQPGAVVTQEDWLSENVSGLALNDKGLVGTVAGDNPVVSPKRRFADASVRFTVPACDTPTVVRMRYDQGETRGGESFVEVSIFSDRASARLVNESGVTAMDEVRLESSDRHAFLGVTIGDNATLSVAGDDILRVTGAGLASRGKLQILPARCANEFEIADFAWTNLRENREQVAFYKTLDTAPAPVLSPEQALASFRLAPGFEIELVASEPLVEDPVAMAWDEYGRLYVVEMRGYMPDAYGTGSEEPVGQVVRLEDTDGDGQMDSSEVYLGGLVNPRAVAVVNEGILIGEPPNLWLCEQPTRDALCTSKRSIGGYADSKEAANVEHMENRLLPGLDNWLYNAKSTRRIRMSGEGLQESHGPSRGQWGISKDDFGRLYYNNNSNWLQVDFFQGEDIIEPGIESYPAGIGVNLTDPSPVYSVRVNPGVNRAYLEGTLRKDGRLNRATGASGLVVYRGDQFPEQYRGHAFVPESAGNVVAQFAVSESAVGVEAEQRTYADEQWGQRDFLGSTDERFRPVDAANGPDGSLYVIDMYRGIIQDDHFLTEELREQIFQRGLDKPVGKGRIWRIRHTDGSQERAIPNLAEADTAGLIAALNHGNGWIRDTAQRLLMKSPGEQVAALEDMVLTADTVPALHAIWTLQGREELRGPVLAKALISGDPQRQIHALRAGAGVLTIDELIAAAPALRDAPEMVRVQYAFALGVGAADYQARAQLVEILSTGVDSVYIRQAVVRASRGHELALLEELLAARAFQAESEGANAALGALAGSAYRSVRPDMTSTETPAPALLALLGLVEARKGEQAWQQIAMLGGFVPLSRTDGFEPARLESAPPIFADASISEADPLWNARLTARVAFTWPGDELALGIKPLSPEQIALMDIGRDYYPTCANCHGASGAGIAGLAPALAGVSWVTGPPEWLARIILQGLNGPLEVNGEQWDGIMPPHGQMPDLDDETLAGLMIYLRRSWGNKADPVSVEQVAQFRQDTASRSQPWTVAELEAVPFDRGYGRFVGKYSVSFVTMTIAETPEGLYLSVPMYGEGVLEQVSETAFRGSAGSETITLDFVVEDDGPASSFILLREGEKITLNRKD